MLGHFATCPTNAACVGICSIQFSRGRGIVQCSLSLCTVRFSFSQHPIGSRLPRLVPRPGPPPSLSFPYSFGDTTARTPASSSGPPLFSFISPSVAHAGSATCPILSPLRCVAFPSSFASINTLGPCFSPSSPFPLSFGAELRNPVDVVKLGSSV